MLFQKFGGRFGLGETQREDLGTVAKLVSRCAFGPEILKNLLGTAATAKVLFFFFYIVFQIYLFLSNFFFHSLKIIFFICSYDAFFSNHFCFFFSGQKKNRQVVCLQEVQFDFNDENSNSFTLPNWLRNLDGYTVCLPGEKYLQQIADRNERVLANRVAIGCAVLFRSDRLVFVEVPDKGEDPNTLVSACLIGHPDSELHDLGPTAFFSVHLDAQSEEKRVEQMKKCLEKARALHTRDAVFAGDMNTECLPGSCIRAYFSSELPSADDMARECASALRISGEDEEENEAGVNTVTELTAEHMEKWKLLWDKAAQAPQEHRMDLQRVPIGWIFFL